MRRLVIWSATFVLSFGAGCVRHHSEITYRVNAATDSADIAVSSGFDSELGPYHRYELPWVGEEGLAESHYLWAQGKRATLHVIARVPSSEKVMVGIVIDGELHAADTAFGTAEALTNWP